jgi:hypothetical protein
MTAIRSNFLGAQPIDSSRPAAEAIRREMLALRTQVRALAEKRARADGDRLTQEIQTITEDAARAMLTACEDGVVLARLHHRLARQVKADLLRAREVDEFSVDASVRALLLDRVNALMQLPRAVGGGAGSGVAHEDSPSGAARAARIFEEHREQVRDRFRALRGCLQMELADLALEMAGETAARLSMRYGRRGQEWLWEGPSRIVDQFVAVSIPATLPAALELLATQAVVSGLKQRLTRT